jgi:hypothetical protein
MTAPTALRIRKRPRRARMLAAVLLTAGIVIGGSTASASAATTSPAGQMTGAAPAVVLGLCHDPLFGGTFWCDTSVGYLSGEAWWLFPDHTRQIFVIGSDNAVWTKWDNTSGDWSGWTSMGGISISYPPKFYINGQFSTKGSGTFTPDLTVVGTDHGVWHRQRGGDGVWDAWTAGY